MERLGSAFSYGVTIEAKQSEPAHVQTKEAEAKFQAWSTTMDFSKRDIEITVSKEQFHLS